MVLRGVSPTGSSPTVSPAKRARALKRRPTPSDDGEQFLSDWLTYVTDTPKKRKLAVGIGPPIAFGGTTTVSICTSCDWLQKAAFDHSTWCLRDSEALYLMISRFKALAKKAIKEQNRSTIDLKTIPVMGAACLQTLSDSECSDADVVKKADVEIADVVKKAARKRRWAQEVTWVKLDLAEFRLGTLDVFMPKNRFVMHIKLNADDCRTLVNAARFFARWLSSCPENSCILPADAERMVWSDARHAFKVCWVAKNKFPRKSYKFFPVERENEAGVAFPDAEMKVEMETVSAQARLFWDGSDESGAVRYSAM